jgi:hypothetical protein
MVSINGYELPSHVSYSSLSTWLDCGWKYYLSRIVNEDETPAWYLVGGSALHAATEDYDRILWAKENTSE